MSQQAPTESSRDVTFFRSTVRLFALGTPLICVTILLLVALSPNVWEAELHPHVRVYKLERKEKVGSRRVGATQIRTEIHLGPIAFASVRELPSGDTEEEISGWNLTGGLETTR